MATLQAQTNRVGTYGGTHGNASVAPFFLTVGAAANDVVVLGDLPMGLMIKSVSAGASAASSGVTVDVKMVKEDGSSVTLATGLDVNNKMTAKDIIPAYTDFATGKVTMQAVVKGAAVAKTTTLHVLVEYITIGTE